MFYWLAERAIKTPSDIALIDGDQAWDFAALNEAAVIMAARLAAAGVQPTHHVAVLMPNRPEYVFLIYALARMGCVLVPLNTRLTADEIRDQLDQADCSLVICSYETEVKANQVRDALWKVVTIDAASDVGLKSMLDVEIEDPDVWRQGRRLMPGQVQAIIHTSGTTGRSKGAMITFTNHFHSAVGSAYKLGTETARRWLLCMPLYHVGGLSIILRCCLYGTTVVLHEGFDVAAVSEAIDRQQISIVSLVPTMLHRLIEHRGGKALPASLKCVLLGGAAASPKLVAECIEHNIPIALTYGLTEACSQVATATPNEVRAKAGSVGKPIMNTVIRIVDEDGRIKPRGEIGEITVAGHSVMKGYYGDPQATERAIHGNWLHTGDLGYLDADEDLWIVQRRSDLIVTGGENVYPAEVEAVLEAHPSVKQVCVVGIEDAEWGQRVAALIVPTNGTQDADSLIAYAREKLAGYKVPRVIQFVDVLPCTASGKIIRSEAARFFEKRPD